MSNLSPYPSREKYPVSKDQGGKYWAEVPLACQKWFSDVKELLAPFATSGLMPWTAISKLGSNLTDLATRKHTDLQDLNTATYSHLTAAEVAEIERLNSVLSVAVSTAMDDSYGTYIVTATGQTMTLPAASTARIGKPWNVVFATTGTCTVQADGTDTMPLPSSAAETSVVMNKRGMSLGFICKTATTWAII